MDLDILYSEYLGVVHSLRLKPMDHVLIASISQQKINHFLHGKSVKAYLMSSSKRKPSCVEGSLGTPSGLHYVCQKIGEGEELGTVFEGRVSIGMTYLECAKGKRRKNLITTRILRLRGLQEGVNKGGAVDTYNRYVYAHGTNHEDRLGKPSSSGCLQMGNDEILELFELVPEGTHLYVTFP
jgi:hypothetical protein